MEQRFLSERRMVVEEQLEPTQRRRKKNQSTNGVDEEPAKEISENEEEEISFGNPHPLVAEVTIAPPDHAQESSERIKDKRTTNWRPKLTTPYEAKQCHCGICLLEQEHKRINAVPRPGGNDTEVVTGNIDSAACHTVGPRSMATAFPVERTEAVANNRNYMAANGTKIMNYGQRIIKGTTTDGTKINMPMQVTDVDK